MLPVGLQCAEVALVDDAAAMQHDDAVGVVRDQRVGPVIGAPPPIGTKVTASRSVAIRARQQVDGSRSREISMVGTNSRQCEKLQRHCGKR